MENIQSKTDLYLMEGRRELHKRTLPTMGGLNALTESKQTSRERLNNGFRTGAHGGPSMDGSALSAVGLPVPCHA